MTAVETWKSTRLKYVADCNRQVLAESTTGDRTFKYVDIGAVGQGTISIPDEITAFSDAPSRARRLAEPGDTVISTVRTYLRAVVTVPETKDDLVFSTGFAVLHPHADVSRRFLAYALQGDAFVDKVVANSVGISYPAITASDLMSLDLLLPPLDDQRAIADYLDQETAQIDALVAKQKEFIGLLRERRVGTVTRAVTKGLDDRPILTDSGVTSLGSIPAHWSVKKVKHLGRALIGLTYTPAQLVGPDEGGTLVLRANNIQNGRIDLTDNVYVGGAVPGDLRARSGDILICARNGSARLIGKNAVLDSSVSGQTWGAFMAVLRSPLNGYLRWVLNSQVFAANMGLYATTTVNQLTNSTLQNLEVAVPPTDEQQEIARYLDEQTSRIDTLIAKAEEHIALAKERRSALITAAVTGQFDVRTARKVA